MICDTSNALLQLFTYAKNTMPADKLSWLTNLSEHSEMEAANIAATLRTLADLMASDNENAQPHGDQLARILWGLSAQADNVSALIHISAEAEFLVNGKRSSSPDSVQTKAAGAEHGLV